MARWYWLSCRQCGWAAQEAVDEATYTRIMREVKYCRECDAAKRPRSEFSAREVITTLLKGHRRP